MRACRQVTRRRRPTRACVSVSPYRAGGNAPRRRDELTHAWDRVWARAYLVPEDLESAVGTCFVTMTAQRDNRVRAQTTYINVTAPQVRVHQWLCG